MIMIYSKRAGAQLSHGPVGPRAPYISRMPVAAMDAIQWANKLLPKAFEKAPALAQLRKWSLGDPPMSRLAACSTSLWFSVAFVVGSAASVSDR
jgi:hypothetical protein